MKTIRVCTETPYGSVDDYFEVSEAAIVFSNRCSYSWYVVDEEEST